MCEVSCKICTGYGRVCDGTAHDYQKKTEMSVLRREKLLQKTDDEINAFGVAPYKKRDRQTLASELARSACLFFCMALIKKYQLLHL